MFGRASDSAATSLNQGDGARLPSYTRPCADAFYKDSLVFSRTSRIKHAASDIVATWSGMSDIKSKVR